MSSTTTVTQTVNSKNQASILNTERGSDGKPKRLHRIPQFEAPEATQKWQLDQMAGAFRVFAKLGYADGGSGHISLRGEYRETYILEPP